MTSQVRRLVAPAFLFLCLILGGSAQGVWGNAILRFLATCLIGWAVFQQRDKPIPPGARALLWLGAGAICLGLLQLVPLPYFIWSALPGRESVVSGFDLLGLQPGFMPLSLAPYDTIATLLALLPPLGMLAALVAFRETSRSWLAAALIAGAIAGILLGLLQVGSANPEASPWYLYRQSNFGVATGFFANANHMASLLVCAIPFAAAAAADLRERTADVKKRSAIFAICAGVLLVLIVGLLLNGSFAGFGLGLAVIMASLVLFLGTGNMAGRFALGASAVTLVVALVILWSNPPSTQLGSARGSVASRQEIFERSARMIGVYAPLGSGIGTFDKVYRAHENPEQVNRFFVNHAHNDYLELAVEMGLPGIILTVFFLAWWALAARRILVSRYPDALAMAGAIASSAILLHSVVDYPLRTAAMSSVFAMCLALMLIPRVEVRRPGELRPVRHLVVG